MKSARLLSLLLLLQARQRMTTHELAERLEVSRRTILRDVEALSAAGVPVYAERGRHGGIVLLAGARLNASYLEPAELDSLALSGLDSNQQKQLGFAAAHEMAARKIDARRAIASDRSLNLGNFILTDNSDWIAPEPSAIHVGDLALDLSSRSRLELRYRNSGTPHALTKTVDPYGLVTKSGRWYLVADLKREARLFNLDRLESYLVLPAPADTRIGHDLRSVWAQLKHRTESLGTVEITALVRQSRLDLAQRILGARLATILPADEGWHSVIIIYPDIESVRQLLQFGDHIEVVAPARARRRFYELATDLAARHR